MFLILLTHSHLLETTTDYIVSIGDAIGLVIEREKILCSSMANVITLMSLINIIEVSEKSF